jgi:PAS domain S-box-containing protein
MMIHEKSKLIHDRAGASPGSLIAFYRELVERTDDWVSVLDVSGTIVFQSPGIESMLGLAPVEVVGRSALALVHTDDRARAEELLHSALGAASRHGTIIVRLNHAGGGARHVELAWTNLLDVPSVRGLVTIARDVTDRVEAEHQQARRIEEIARENAELRLRLSHCAAELAVAEGRVREMHEAHKRFIADASHDLRTPLTTISGEAELLERYVASADARASVDAIRSEARRLDSLSTDLLFLAALDAGTFADHFAPIRVDEILLETIARHKRDGRSEGIEWQVDVAGPAVVKGDAASLARAVSCVLDNAVKYSGPGAHIRVELREPGGRAQITIADTGCGIADWDRPYVFDRFYRGDASRSSAGAGLGLTIVKSVVTAHGGTVRIDSLPSSGTTVTMTLSMKNESRTRARKRSASC